MSLSSKKDGTIQSNTNRARAPGVKAIMNKGRHSSQQFRNACILLNCDASEISRPPFSNEQIAGMLQVNAKTVERLKQRFVEEGFEAYMERKSYKGSKELKADGDFETHLVALCCSKAPTGRFRWLLRLLAYKMVELSYAESVLHETVRQVLKKTKLNRGK